MDKTIENYETLKIAESWKLCKEVTDLVALVGAVKEKKLLIPIEYYRLLDLKSKSLMSYVKDLLEYAESRDNQ